MLNAITMAITASVVMVFVSVVMSLLAFMNASFNPKVTRFILMPKIVMPGLGIDGMPMAFKDMFEKIDGVKFVQRKVIVPGRHDSGTTYLVAGEEESGIELNPDIWPVEPAVFEAWKKEQPQGAIVSEALARDLRLTVGAPAEIPTSTGPLQIKVVGIVRNSLIKYTVAVHFDYLQEFTKNTGVCGYRVFAKPEAAEAVARAIIDQTKNSAMPAQPLGDAAIRSGIARRAGTVPAILGFLGIFLIFTTILTLANNSAISVRERRTEIATLRVLGYYRGTIVRLFVSEAVLVGLFGGVIAAVAMTFLFRGGVRLVEGPLLDTVTITPVAMASGLIVSILVPLLGSLPSALAAVRLPLVEGLRDTA